ncbi:MAG: DUF418 domain-containing protein [Longimicrobiaceae bacterium]
MSLVTPVPAGERAPVLDALRGFALFGVCLANLFTAFALLGAPGAPVIPGGRAHEVAAFLIHALIDGKFYSLFSLLFGIGFTIQMRRAEAAGDPELRRFRRRLWILLAIGLTHLCLVWSGDILAFYALVGFLLIRFRHVSDRRLLTWAAVLLVIPVLMYLPYWATGGGRGGIPVTPAIVFWLPGMLVGKLVGLQPMAQPDLLHGGWRAYGQSLATGVFFRAASLTFEWRICKVLATFLLGLWIGRRRPWEDLQAFRPLLRRVATLGLAVGLPASLGMAAIGTGQEYYLGTGDGLIHAVLYAVGVPSLALAYAALFGLGWTSPRVRPALAVLAPTGRMALTSYLTQSVVGVLLFYDIGLGLGGRVGPALLWPLAVLILAAQTAFATLWLRRYRFGPAEWAWRSLTYRARQPMRIERPRSPAPALTG